MAESLNNDALSETYLQISPNILASFPKFRPPVDLYCFDPRVAQTKKYHKAGQRLSTDGQAEVAGFAENGQLYLLRDDYRVYAEHLSKRLGLLLVEEGFTSLEVAEIFFLAFRDRMDAFFAQPQKKAYEALKKDVSVLAEYLWIDPARVEFLTRTLDREYSLAVHSTNTMLIGLALYLRLTDGKVEKTALASLALGLLLHDMGMAKVPKFIKDKQQLLVRRDRESIEHHIDAGRNILKRLKEEDSVIRECLTQHHERLDGSGYPERRFSKAISMAGKLCAVADSYSALIGDRPYRSAHDMAEAALVLVRDAKKYEPALARMLVEVLAGGVESTA
ncbi:MULTISPECIES: HD domain-containing phosphohydrolase [unclassified Pseudodesulfovibrio]|uniref:HD-GYP domain-containing protein n=1 Tax=unclassified Pseudodesulfovibrio TaxID=2661612 RepID=UPI000FEBAAB0|nr:MULTISPECIES: HD domain-containing phosphohydrolase [unclassified Pseudodesulfovibrio]MCJ2163576.1 HD domain-containing protein [Pseudodesulfovibrio sp. S3-i]RWU06879.1 HD domain-containing protein [Pseudodesulfovibrio sp. S3]